MRGSKPLAHGASSHCSMVSIMASIWGSVKWRAVMAPLGHQATQVPQPLQEALLMVGHRHAQFAGLQARAR